VLVQDADLEYSPQDYGQMLAPFGDPAVQAVYGSRFLLRRWPERMKVANWAANKLFVATTNLLYGSALTDEGTGYKAIRRELLQDLEIASSRFEFCPEVTAKLLRRGVRILEVPVSYSARDRKQGKKPGFRDGLSVLWTLVRLRFSA
jgi:dolichol-phosphate mannosyltransferase